MNVENQATETVGYVSTSRMAADAGAFLARAEQGARRVQVGGKVQVGAVAPRPPEEPMLRFFAFTHLPAHLQDVSAPFHALAHAIVRVLPKNAERTVALRKTLEAKDAAVRAMVFP